MAEVAVAVSLFFTDKVIHYMGKKKSHRDLDVHADVKDIGDRLRTMQAYLKDMEAREISEGLKVRINQVRSIAFEIEDVLDVYMLYVLHPNHKHKLPNKAHRYLNGVLHWNSLRGVKSKIKEIKIKIKGIKDMDSFRPDSNVPTFEEGSSSSSGVEHHVTPQILEDEIVGFEKPREDLIRQLTAEGGGSSGLTISVVGPGGSGKTLLVKSVYRSEEVQRNFHTHAWVRVSRPLKMEELINSILKQIGVPEEELNIHEGENIQEKLEYYLLRRRYVLVLDDIWRRNDWERIKNVLPNGSSGSRIIVTTRNKDVATFCVESQQCIHSLNCLTWEDAWKLFCKKAFPDKCPPHLEEWSQKIVKRCEGLPDSIVKVGRWLSKKQQFPNEWKKLHDRLGSGIDPCASHSIISSVLLPSYRDLPSHLKCCFLYFSIFPEDYSVERGRLVRLWVAEGFVKEVEGNNEITPEEVAEEYLDQLIERNLVHVSKWDFDGRARSCRVLNLVLDFIVYKSEGENFVSILSKPNHSLSSDQVRRLSIRNACAILSQGSRFSSVRSTFFFRCETSDVENVRDFKYLRVLDLQNAPVDKFPEGIDHLSLLRYLSLSHTNVKVVPKSIKKLPNLETLDLKQTFVTELPAKIVRLVKLRHLLVYHHNAKTSATSDAVQGVQCNNATIFATSNTVKGVQMSAGIGTLTALQKLSLVKPDKHRKIIKELGALTQLRRLGLIELERKDGKDLCASIQKMENLVTLDLSSINIINESLDLSSTRIESLDLDHMTSPPPGLQRLYLKGRLEKFPGWISKLQNLFRIRLKWSGLQGSPLEALEDLPCLMELELVDVSSCNELVFRAEKFMKLKKLHIEEFRQPHTVKVEEGAMPELQKLTMYRCLNLKMLLLGIKTLTHIEELLLDGMHEDFSVLHQRTREDQDIASHIPVIQSLRTLGSLQNLSSFILEANMESATARI